MGTVYLVGAGPGDPGLLTLRGAQLLRRADVVIHDRGVSARTLELLPFDAERREVGLHYATQEAVNQGLVDAVRAHDVVIRLKVGDPFVFGRGGEEALHLRRAGVSFEVVPGVSAGIAAPAYAGIPVTHAGVSTRLVLRDAAQAVGQVEAESGGAGQTLVAFMATRHLEAFVRRLLDEGLPGEAPAAVVQCGTTPRQRTVRAPLAELAERASEAGVGSPAVVIVGEVVNLRDRLGWFEARPLFDRRIVVTRARAQAGDLVDLLESLGAEPVVFPTIRIASPPDEGPLLEAARDVAFYDWVIFTSVNGVERFFAALEAAGQDARALGGVQVACIGPATAVACELHGVRPELVPPKFVAEAMVEAMAGHTELQDARILLPRAWGARDVLPDGLQRHGARVDEVEAYRSVADTEGGAELRRRLLAGEIDALTFTSSSTVRNFVAAVGNDVGRAAVAVIGPITAGTARELGLRVDIEAEEHTIPGLVDALVQYYGRGADGETS